MVKSNGITFVFLDTRGRRWPRLRLKGRIIGKEEGERHVKIKRREKGDERDMNEARPAMTAVDMMRDTKALPVENEGFVEP